MDKRPRHRPPTITTTTMAPVTTTTTPRLSTIPPWTLAMDRVTIQVHSHLTIPVTIWTFSDPPVATSHPRHRPCRLRPRQQLPCPGSEVYRDQDSRTGSAIITTITISQDPHPRWQLHQQPRQPLRLQPPHVPLYQGSDQDSRMGSILPSRTPWDPLPILTGSWQRHFAHSRHYLSLCSVSPDTLDTFSPAFSVLIAWREPPTVTWHVPRMASRGYTIRKNSVWKGSGNVSREMNQILIRECSEDRIIWSFFVHLSTKWFIATDCSNENVLWFLIQLRKCGSVL